MLGLKGFYLSPTFLWAIPSVLFLFLGRIWLTSQYGQLRGDHVAFALKDKYHDKSIGAAHHS